MKVINLCKKGEAMGATSEVGTFTGVRANWLLHEICFENGFLDPDQLKVELSLVSTMSIGHRLDMLSECWMSYPTMAF